MKYILNHYIVPKDQIYNKKVNTYLKASTKKAGQWERKGDKGYSKMEEGKGTLLNVNIF